ncbi:MAG: VOC family protein [bacterium]
MTRLLTMTLLACAAVACLGAAPAFAGDDMEMPDEPALMGIVFATINVPDQDAAIEWYTTALKLEVTEDMSFGDFRWVQVGFPESDMDFPQLALITEDADMRADMGLTPPHPDENIMFGVSDCAGMCEFIRSHDGTILVEPAEYPWGTECTFQDPWGNAFTMVQPSAAAMAGTVDETAAEVAEHTS